MQLCIEADAQYRRFEVVFPQKLGQWSSVLDMYFVWIIKKWLLVLCIKYVWLIENLKSGQWYGLLSVYGLIFFHFLVQCMI